MKDGVCRSAGKSVVVRTNEATKNASPSPTVRVSVFVFRFVSFLNKPGTQRFAPDSLSISFLLLVDLYFWILPGFSIHRLLEERGGGRRQRTLNFYFLLF